MQNDEDRTVIPFLPDPYTEDRTALIPVPPGTLLPPDSASPSTSLLSVRRTLSQLTGSIKPAVSGRGKKLFASLIAILVLLIAASSGVLIYVNHNTQVAMQQAQATAVVRATHTAVARATNTAIAQATSTAIAATSTAVAATSTAVAATSTAVAQATGTAVGIAQQAEEATFGGTLSISDPMTKPGSNFAWDTGNSQGGSCNFKNNGYHVFGYCSAEGPHIPANFVFETRLVDNYSCGEIDLTFSGDDDHAFSIDVCHSGYYSLAKLSGSDNNVTSQNGTDDSMHTGPDEANIIDVVANRGQITLYINSVKMTSLSDDATHSGSIGLGGLSLDSVVGNTSVTKSEYREVTYTNTILWSFP